jgi:hypothetical protein
MPVIPAFDPSTGASGGPSTDAGSNATWIPIESLSDPSWTSSDPNALVTSYAFAGQEHSIAMVTVNPAVADYALNSGTDFTGPRWYKGLVDASGQAVRAQDRFSLFVRWRDVDVGLSRQWGIWVGVAQTPASTVLTTLGTVGGWFGATGVGTPNIGAGASGSGTVTTVSLASGVNGQVSGLFGGLPGKVRCGVIGTIFTASAADDVARTDGLAWTVADGTQLSLWVGVTALGNVTTTAGTLKAKLDYAIVRL